MRVFVTGATGFVGSAVVRELIGAGHEVLGLARSEDAAASLVAVGAQAYRGDLDDLASLRRGAERADGVIHTAFNHDFTKFKENCEADRRVIAALGDALAGSQRLVIVTSGIGVLPQGRLATEDARPVAGPGAHPRAASEEAADALAARGLRASVMRLPPSVHGAGDHGFVPILIGIARQKGTAAYCGDGGNLWPAVHRLDAARLYRLALETSDVAAGERFHAVAEQGVPMRDIAAAIGRGLSLPTAAKTAEDAASHFGWFAHFAALDVPASSARTRERLGWRPEQPGLIADLGAAGYFA